jgi:hypothetical protein
VRASVVLAAVLVAAASGCGGGAGGEAGDLEFTREDGTTAQFPKSVRAWCAPFDEDNPDVEGVHVLAGELPQSEPPEAYWWMLAARRDVEQGPTTLPNDFVHTEPRGAALFVLDDAEHRNNELSSATEESTGTIGVELDGCETGDAVRVAVEDVTLGSESSDLPTMSVEGSVEAEIGSPP